MGLGNFCFIVFDFEVSDYPNRTEQPFLYSFFNLKMIWKTDSFGIMDLAGFNCNRIVQMAQCFGKGIFFGIS